MGGPEVRRTRYLRLDAGRVVEACRCPHHRMEGAVEMASLASGLTRKIWQEIMVLDRMALEA